MKLTNQEIYMKATELSVAFTNETKKYIPVKLNFAIQKNFSTLCKAQEEIEKAKIEIAKEYGELSEDGTKYLISEDKKEQAQQELNDLFSIEQDMDIKTCSLSQIENIDLTMEQMQAIMFMITED